MVWYGAARVSGLCWLTGWLGTLAQVQQLIGGSHLPLWMKTDFPCFRPQLFLPDLALLTAFILLVLGKVEHQGGLLWWSHLPLNDSPSILIEEKASKTCQHSISNVWEQGTPACLCVDKNFLTPRNLESLSNHHEKTASQYWLWFGMSTLRMSRVSFRQRNKFF